MTICVHRTSPHKLLEDNINNEEYMITSHYMGKYRLFIHASPSKEIAKV